MLKLCQFSLLLVVATASYAQTTPLPSWFNRTLMAKGLDRRFTLTGFLTPTTLVADFNGDTHQDLAVLVIGKANKKKGILLIHGKTGDYFIFGAGVDFGNGSDNFNWLDNWSLYTKKSVDETQFDADDNITGSKAIKLTRPGLLILAYEDGHPTAGALLYWNGERYIWIHQGE